MAGALGLFAGRAFAQEPPAPDAAPKLRVRRNIKDLTRSDPDVQAFRMAVKKMRQSGAWKRQVAYHADMNRLHHSSWRFLPWHRLQVAHMEKLVAKISGHDDFAMPYWDWSDDTIPALFADDDVLTLRNRECGVKESIAEFLKANDTQLADRSRNDFGTFFGKPRLLGQPMDRESGQQRFSGSAEWSGHNLIHSFVGGDMGVLETAPNDPLFWLHHSNVDRGWVAWSAKHSDSDYAGEWSLEQLSGFEDPDGTNPAPVAAMTTIDPAKLGYTYEVPRRAPMMAARPMSERGAARRVRVEQYQFEMERIGPNKGVIRIPPEKAQAFSAQAVGYLQIDPDPAHASATRIVCKDMTDGSVPFDDKLFLVPMGMSMGLQNYRMDLSGVWSGAGVKGLELTAQTGPLVGRKSGRHPPAIAAFVVDAQAMFYE
jgi:hypothetical protein